MREQAPSHRVAPGGAVVSKDQVPAERETTRAMPFLPDPPSFDLTTINRNQRYGLLHCQGEMSEVTRLGGVSGLNLLTSACDLVPYL